MNKPERNIDPFLRGCGDYMTGCGADMLGLLAGIVAVMLGLGFIALLFVAPGVAGLIVVALVVLFIVWGMRPRV